MTYILRIPFNRKPRYGTVADEAHLTVRYKPILRAKGKLGPFTKVEEVGKDKSAVDIRVSAKTVVNERGGKGLYPDHQRVRLLDRHQHIRRLRAEDETAIADWDARLAAKQAELRALQDQRSAAVAGAWRRAEKVPISDLEDLANPNI